MNVIIQVLRKIITDLEFYACDNHLKTKVSRRNFQIKSEQICSQNTWTNRNVQEKSPTVGEWSRMELWTGKGRMPRPVWENTARLEEPNKKRKQSWHIGEWGSNETFQLFAKCFVYLFTYMCVFVYCMHMCWYTCASILAQWTIFSPHYSFF